MWAVIDVETTGLYWRTVDRIVEVAVVRQASGKVAEIRVLDRGPGVSRKNSGRIFEKFFRVPTGDVHNTKGFGLGLYYVSKIVEAHRGRITVESQSGQGSVFTIYLPLKKQ